MYSEAEEYSLRRMLVVSCWGTLQLPINIKPDWQLPSCCPGAHLISLQTTQISSGKIIFFLLLVRAHHSPNQILSLCLHPLLLLSTFEEQVSYIYVLKYSLKWLKLQNLVYNNLGQLSMTRIILKLPFAIYTSLLYTLFPSWLFMRNWSNFFHSGYTVRLSLLQYSGL